MSSALDDLGGLAKSASILFVGAVLGRVLALVGEALIARSLAPASFGHVALAYTLVSAIGSLALLGIPEGVTRLMSAAESPKRQWRVLYSGYTITLVGGPAAVLGIYLLRFRIAGVMNDDQLATLLIAFAPYLLLFPLAQVSFSVLRAHGRSTAAILTRDVGSRVGGLILFAAFAIGGTPILGAIAYWVAIPAVLGMFSLYYVRQELALGSLSDHFPDRETLRDLWSFSWPLAAGASIFLFLSKLDILMIGYYLNSQSVGYYRAIQPLRQVTTFVLASFGFLYLPLATQYYSRGDLSELHDLYVVSTKWIVAATLPPVLVFSLFAPDVVRLFFGSDYLPGAPALAILTGGLLFRAIVGLNGDMVKAIDRPRIEMFSAAVGVLANLVLNVLLVPRYGIVGAAIATVVSYALYNAVEVAAIHRFTGSHPFSADTLKPLVPTTLVGVALMRLTDGYDLGLFGLVGIGLVLSVVQLLSMVATRSLDDADRFLLERIESRTGLDLTWLKSTIRNRSRT